MNSINPLYFNKVHTKLPYYQSFLYLLNNHNHQDCLSYYTFVMILHEIRVLLYRYNQGS